MNYPHDRDVRSMQEVDGSVRGTYDDPRFAGEIAAAPMSEIPHSLSRLAESNNRLHETIKLLHERLQPVRNKHSEHSDGDKAVRGYGSDLAQQIGQEADKVDMATDVIIKILNELEV